MKYIAKFEKVVADYIAAAKDLEGMDPHGPEFIECRGKVAALHKELALYFKGVFITHPYLIGANTLKSMYNAILTARKEC